MTMLSEKKVILITGSSHGIGRYTAEILAREGHTVYATMRGIDRRNAPARTALTKLAETEGLDLRVLELDVTDDASVEAAVAAVVERSGRIDVVVNNAGTMFVGVTEAYTLEKARQQMETNFFGVLRVNRAVLPHMRARGDGLLIHVTSLAGRIVFPFFGIYSASKFALEALAEAFRYELSPFGVDSVIVEPGPFGTNLIASVHPSDDHVRLKEYGDVAQIPVNMLSSFDQFLSSDDAPDAREVAGAVRDLIATPKGERPLRTVVGIDYGVRALNEAVAPTQQGLLEALEMTALATPASPVSG